MIVYDLLMCCFVAFCFFFIICILFFLGARNCCVVVFCFLCDDVCVCCLRCVQNDCAVCGCVRVAMCV